MYTYIQHQKSLLHAEKLKRKRLDKKNASAQASRRISKLNLLLKSIVTPASEHKERILHEEKKQTMLSIKEEDLIIIHEHDSFEFNEEDDTEDQQSFDYLEDQQSSDYLEEHQIENNTDDAIKGTSDVTVDVDQVSVQFNCVEDQARQYLHSALHNYSNASTLDYCESVSSFLRMSNISKSHSTLLLKMVKSYLPVPNNVPSTIEELLSLLNVENLFTKRSVCTLCKNTLNYDETQCVICRSSDQTSIAHIYDVNVQRVLEVVIERLSPNIEAYKQQININDDKDKTGDIPFRYLYQQLLKQNQQQNLISLLLHLDGVGITKSTRLKLWMFSGSIVELPSYLRYRRHNMILMSVWVGFVEPEPNIWLGSIINKLNYLKTLGL